MTWDIDAPAWSNEAILMTLQNARLKTRNDWVADAILVEAQLAFKYGYTGARVAKFAQSLIKAFGYGNQT